MKTGGEVGVSSKEAIGRSPCTPTVAVVGGFAHLSSESSLALGTLTIRSRVFLQTYSSFIFTFGKKERERLFHRPEGRSDIAAH
jgi:hypothetical protein